MSRLYGRPTKLVRHNVDTQFVVEPQRLHIETLWQLSKSTTRSDGDDVTDRFLAYGSRVTKHRMDMTMIPSTVDPQNVYWGMVRLSFDDVFSPYVCGFWYNAAGEKQLVTSYLNITPADTFGQVVAPAADQTINLSDVRLDDYFKHWVRLKKLTVYDQQPLISDRRMKIPGKVKRGNDGTYYGIWFFNDAPRGSTPADTAVSLDYKSYFEEWAI